MDPSNAHFLLLDRPSPLLDAWGAYWGRPPPLLLLLASYPYVTPRSPPGVAGDFCPYFWGILVCVHRVARAGEGIALPMDSVAIFCVCCDIFLASEDT